MPKREFNFNHFKQRHVALKLAYFGWDYAGLAVQASTAKTIEGQLLNALLKTTLIRSVGSCSLVKCGRTDKGVSSYGQVLNLNVRSRLTDEVNPKNLGLFTPLDYTGSSPPEIKRRRSNCPADNEDSQIDQSGQQKCEHDELDYVYMLNKVLPDDIRVLSWAPVARSFSSRFNCQRRSYSYIFPIGNLNATAMSEALGYLCGEHDFRNLCTLDLDNNVHEHRRTIYSATIEPIETTSNMERQSYCYYRIRIVGKAFLYHQIRCIMTIIFLIGEKYEQPQLIKSLLDITACPSKPMYNYANPLPLSLASCEFDEAIDLPLGWQCSSSALVSLRNHLKAFWFEAKTKTTMIEDLLLKVEQTVAGRSVVASSSDRNLFTASWRDFGIACDRRAPSRYVPMMNRKREASLEERLNILHERRKQPPIVMTANDDEVKIVAEAESCPTNYQHLAAE